MISTSMVQASCLGTSSKTIGHALIAGRASQMSIATVRPGSPHQRKWRQTLFG